MKTIEELKSEERELSGRIQALERDSYILCAQQREIQTQIAHMSTTFKVGDRVTLDQGKTVYELHAISHWYGDAPSFHGRKIKKNGKPGLIISRLNVYGNRKLELVA